MKPKITSTSLQTSLVPLTTVTSPPTQSNQTPRQNFIKQQKLEQRLKNQKIKALSKQKETKNQFWKALNDHVRQEVVKINKARD